MDYQDAENFKKQILERLFTLIAVVGFLLVVYGIFTEWFLDKWRPIEKISTVISVYVTLIATLLTAISIYVPPTKHYPKVFKRYVSSPVMIISMCIAIYYASTHGGQLSNHILNGLSIITLSDALVRLYNLS